LIKLVGVGYKATKEEETINLRVGLSHNVSIPITEGVDCQVPTSNRILISGADLHKISQFAAKIRRVRPPEPYSGKGIYVGDETIKRKEGKRSK
jgi:large subunit ribosomal protein L6